MFEQLLEKAEKYMFNLHGIMKVVNKVASSNPTVSKLGLSLKLFEDQFKGDESKHFSGQLVIIIWRLLP